MSNLKWRKQNWVRRGKKIPDIERRNLVTRVQNKITMSHDNIHKNRMMAKYPFY